VQRHPSLELGCRDFAGRRSISLTPGTDEAAFTTIADFGAKRALFGPIWPKDAPLAV